MSGALHPPSQGGTADEQLARVHQDFAYAVSHDLGAPLRQIASYVELLQMSLGDRLSDREKLWLGHLVQAADTSQSMLRGLLRYSRLATRSEAPQAVDLRETVARALSHCEAPEGRVQTDIPAVTVHAVPAQLRTLGQELVTNALRHSGEGPVQVSATMDTRGLHFLVSDTGCGIAAARRDEALQLFAVLDRGHPGSGMGLGLSLCQRIMQLHGGDLTLSDTNGGGLTVTCSFPTASVLDQVASAG